MYNTIILIGLFRVYFIYYESVFILNIYLQLFYTFFYLVHLD